MKQIKLNDKIKYVKQILRTPYHFFYVGQKSNLVGIRYEKRNGENYSFTGESMLNAVDISENYVTTEVKAGNLNGPVINSKKQHEDK